MTRKNIKTGSSSPWILDYMTEVSLIAAALSLFSLFFVILLQGRKVEISSANGQIVINSRNALNNIEAGYSFECGIENADSSDARIFCKTPVTEPEIQIAIPTVITVVTAFVSLLPFLKRLLGR